MELVTGATGFIGRRLTARLLAEGRDVRALVLPAEAAQVAANVAAYGLDRAEIIHGDITDRDSLEGAFAGVSRVYHLAAVVGDWGDDAVFQRVNVEGTRNVLEAAAQAACERVVVVSSIAVYGGQLATAACHETMPREYGVGAYSRSKRAAEQLALDHHHLGYVPVTVVRPGNVYGPGAALWVDEVVRLIRAGRAMLIDRGHGDATLAYVDNVVDVLVRAGVAAHAAGRIYNVNDGSGVSWRRYFADLAAITGAPAPERSIPAPAARLVAAAMERAWRGLGKAARPLVTHEAVNLLASKRPVPIGRAKDELGYDPLPYSDALEHVAQHIRGGDV